MLKPYYYVAILLGTAVSNSTLANCTTSPTFNSGGLKNALKGKTICYPGSQEEHHGNGNAESELWDYKTGNTSDPVDPRKQIGTWGVSGNPAQVEYNYNDGTNSSGPFVFTPHDNGGGSISFCSGSTEVVLATIEPGFSGCP